MARLAPSSVMSMDYEAVKKRLACAVVRFQDKILHGDLNAGSLCQVKPQCRPLSRVTCLPWSAFVHLRSSCKAQIRMVARGGAAGSCRHHNVAAAPLVMLLRDQQLTHAWEAVGVSGFWRMALVAGEQS